MAASPVEAVDPRSYGTLRRLRVGDVELDLDAHLLRARGKVGPMPPKEFALLSVLMDNAGRVMTRRQLLDQAWSPAYPDENNTLEVHIRRVRRRIEPDPKTPTRIRTVHHLGYVFDLPE